LSLAVLMPTWSLADDVTTSKTPASQTNIDEPASAPEKQATDSDRPVEKARRTYMGRIVAQYMSHLGASWLVRPERNDEENALEAFDQLGIQPGMTLVDLGCGNGYWTLPMAKACVRQPPLNADASSADENADEDDTESLDGQVLAVDIQPEMLQKLRENMLRAGVDNIQPILGKVDDPRLPAGKVDLVLLVDVYHEFSHPESMLWSIRRSLKPEGVIALLEYRAEDPDVPIKPLHKMSKSQILKEYAASNLKLVREYNELPWQHLMFFARDDSPLPEIEAKSASEEEAP
jgi:ubiquinone/menaquinone biosynthesis C-methylase UbiE